MEHDGFKIMVKIITCVDPHKISLGKGHMDSSRGGIPPRVDNWLHTKPKISNLAPCGFGLGPKLTRFIKYLAPGYFGPIFPYVQYVL